MRKYGIMQEVLIRGIDFESTEEIHDYIAEELSFPSYYGKNLDALYDVLTDLSRETRIRIDLTDTENEEIRDYLLRMEEVMEDAAAENSWLTIETE